MLKVILSLGDLNTVLWISFALVMSIVYGLSKDRSVFSLMISAYVSFIVSFFKLAFNLQFIVFIIIYLSLYFTLKIEKKKNERRV